jgi:hypothetical protein
MNPKGVAMKIKRVAITSSGWGSDYNMAPKTQSGPLDEEPLHPNVDALEQVMEQTEDDIKSQKGWPRGMGARGKRNPPKDANTGHQGEQITV